MPAINVFIFPCGSEVGLEIHKALSQTKNVLLLGGASVPDCGELIFDRYIGNLPFVGSVELLPAVQSLLETYKIDFVFPAHDAATVIFSKWYEDGLLGSARVVGSSATASALARSKAATYDRLKHIVPTPRQHASAEAIDCFPVFLKPDVGQGAKGTYTARTCDEAAFYCELDPSLLILEFLPGREFTIDCFSDAQGELRFARARERSRILNGISAATQSNNDPIFADLALRIHREVCFRGAWFFQVKERQNGTLVLMEIATRIAGASCYHRIQGVNLPMLSLFDRMDLPVEIVGNSIPVRMERCLQNRYRIDFEYDCVYVDLDDTLICRGKPNSQLLAALYQLKWEGKELHLLTRHRSRHGSSPVDILDRAAVHRAIFSRIIDVEEGELKSTKVNSRRAIFIDDSFAERKDVALNCRIPVFDVVEAIELFH